MRFAKVKLLTPEKLLLLEQTFVLDKSNGFAQVKRLLLTKVMALRCKTDSFEKIRGFVKV